MPELPMPIEFDEPETCEIVEPCSVRQPDGDNAAGFPTREPEALRPTSTLEKSTILYQQSEDTAAVSIMTRPASPHICSDNCHDFKSTLGINRHLKQLECIKCKYKIIMQTDGKKCCHSGADHEYSAKRGKTQYIKKLVCRVCLLETTVKIDLDDHWI